MLERIDFHTAFHDGFFICTSHLFNPNKPDPTSATDNKQRANAAKVVCEPKAQISPEPGRFPVGLCLP